MQEELLKFYNCKSLIKVSTRTKKEWYGIISNLNIPEKYITLHNDQEDRSAVISFDNILEIIELDKERIRGSEGNGRIV